MNRLTTLLASCLVVALLALPAGARQRENTVGLGLNLVTGGDTNPGLFGGSQSNDLRFFYGAYPSIALTSEGALSTVGLSYAFGIDRTETDPKLQSESHSASLGWSRSLGTRGTLSVSDGFSWTSDLQTLNAFQAIPTDPDGFDFIFQPVTTDRSAMSNNVRFGLDYAVTAQSALVFNSTHSFRNYGNDGQFSGLSDQQRASGGMTYRRRLSMRTSVTAGYTAVYLDFQDFDNTISHVGQVGYSAEVAPDLTFSLSGGPTFVTSRGAAGSYLGYNATASLRKELENSLISLYYSAQSGESSGLGGASDTRRGGVSITQDARRVTVFLDGSVFDSRGRLGTAERFSGVSGSATIGFPFAENWSVEGGVRYQRYTRTTEFGFSQERVFASVRFNDPDVWRFLR